MAKSKRDEYLGKVYVNNQGLKMKIVNYENYQDVTVQFEDGKTRKSTMGGIKNGSLNHPNTALKSKDDYIGKVYVNNQGLKMRVIKYENARDVTVEFEDGATRSSQISAIIDGRIKHPSNRLNNIEDYMGKVYTNNQGLKMKIVDYEDSKNVTVEFEDGARRKAYAVHIKNGDVRHPDFMLKNRAEEFLGKTFKNNQGLNMSIVRFNNSSDIDVQFEDGHVVEGCRLYSVQCGEIKNPYYPSVCGVGYMGVGKYIAGENNRRTREYSVWIGMLTRCYSEEHQKIHKTYRGCTVAREWHNFQNFADWYNREYYDIGESLDIDKDFKNKGNKIYSPENCLIVPSRINNIARHIKSKNYKYPIGVSKRDNGFEARMSIGSRKVSAGTYDTPEEAFQAYKQAKEAYIQQVANEYKQKYGDKFPDKVYKALMNYRVEITD